MLRSARRCGWRSIALGLVMLGTGRSEALEALYGGDHYQSELIQAAHARHKLEPEPAPEGKIIERIVSVPYDVFLTEDPYPSFLNWFHVTTLPLVVEREMLFKVGEPWAADRVAESSRNLRSNLFVSVARIIPAKGSAPNKVVALIVTKDTWSLRTNAEFQLVGSQLQFLDAQLTEENLLGRRKRATIDFGLNPAVYYAGLQYRDPRLVGSQLNLVNRGDLIWNRTTGVLEGGVANLKIEQPLYTLDTPWAWIADFQYRKDIKRVFTAGEVAKFQSSTTGELIPYELNRHLLDFQLGGTRSTGREHKRDFSFGYRSFVHLYGVPAQAVQPATLQDFESSVLPRSESVGLLYAGVRLYQGNFRELMDIETYAITEDYRMGFDFLVETRFASSWLGFDSQYFHPILKATWTSFERDDLFSASLGAEVRYQPQLNPSNPWVNGLVSLGVRNVTPRFSIFRLHTALRGGRRFNDYNHDLSVLGGESSLRGYPVAYLIGANFWNGNVEMRTAPLAMSTIHLGFAGFFDIGSASNDISHLSPHASIGGGFRIGLPQFNREILRIDFGIPLEAVDGTPTYFLAQYGQAF